MGRGGPFTALFGLFVFAVWLCIEIFKWAVVYAICGLILAYRGIRWLYRRRKHERELREPERKIALGEAPKPYMSPVEKREYPGDDWS